MIKIFIPSYGREKTIKTHKYFSNEKLWDLKVVVHTEEHKKEYEKHNPDLVGKILVSNAPPGVINQRAWILDQVSEGEWFITADDNIRDVKKLRDELYKNDIQVTDKTRYNSYLAAEYRRTAPQEEIYEVFLDMMDLSDKYNIHYFGFTAVENYMFNLKKYNFFGYVISKLGGIKKSKLRYDTNLEAMEDFGWTVANHLYFGAILRNNFVFPNAGHYEEGGIGTYEKRVPRKIVDCKYLMKKYPGFFSYLKKKNCHPEAELKINITNQKQLNTRRNKMLKG